MRQPEATVFGGLLTNFQKQRKLGIEMAKRQLMRRNKVKTLGGKYRIEERHGVGLDGSTIHSMELWQLVDDEHVKISTSVEVSPIGKVDEDIKKLMS